MEDKHSHTKPNWYQQCLEHCEAFGISKTNIKIFFHLQEQKHEQNKKKTEDSRL